MRYAAIVSILLLSACSQPPPGAVTIELSAGPHDRRDTPITFDLPANLADSPRYTLERADTGAPIPVQRLSGEPARVAWILAEPLPAGQTRRYTLRPAPPTDNANPAVIATDSSRAITVQIGSDPVLVYNSATLDPPEGADPVYRRSGFIHPLYTPSGNIVTDDFPPDHYHQHGLFFAWVNTTFEGREVDFWNQAKKQGDVEHFAVKQVRSGSVFAEFTVVLSHIDRTAPDPPKRVLEETWTVRVYNVGTPRLIDLVSEQRTASSAALAINEYHYGGLAIRGAREWFNAPDAGITTSEGKDRIDGNHTRPTWVEMYGQTAGVAIMGAPDNYRYPQPVRLHPTKPYFCFAPMVTGEFRIAPGQTYRSRYRILVHDGHPNPSQNNRIWQDYTSPPILVARLPREAA